MKIFIFIIVIMGMIMLFKSLSPRRYSSRKNEHIDSDKTNDYSYNRKEYLITRAEQEFLNILMEAVGNRYFVFPQMHLSHLLDNKIKGQSWHGALRHIDEKSVDFVICDKEYIKPLLAIELDDKTHEWESRQERDEEVERIFNEVDLPLLRFESNKDYNVEEIRQIILETLEK